MMKSVREFTEAAGDEWPKDGPHVMTLEEVDFVAKMVVDELMELYASVTDSDEAKTKMTNHVTLSKSITKEPEPTAASQADAFVDITIYVYNAAAKKGMNLDSVFNEVHAANMRKAVNGKFIRREDGKILKPEGWIGPDVDAALKQTHVKEDFPSNLELLFLVLFLFIYGKLFM